MTSFVGSAALVVLLVAAYRAQRQLLRSVHEGRAAVVAATLIPVLAVLPERLGALLGGLVQGLIATVAALGAGAVLAGRSTRTTGVLPPLPFARARQLTAMPWQTWAIGLLLLAGIAHVTVTTWLWDESSTHLGFAAALARGVLPLEQPLFPGQVVRYHIGFDVLGGLVRAFTALPIDIALDVVTLTCAAVLVMTLIALGRALVPHGGGALCALLVVPLGAGPAAALLADGWGVPLPGRVLFPAAWVSGATFPPMPITNYFQHPQGTAMPVACAVLLLVAESRSLARFAIGCLLVGLLAQVQAVFFVHMGVALTVVAVLHTVAERDLQRGALRVIGLACALALGLMLGGLVGAGDSAVSALQVGVGYFGHDGVVARNLLSFGAALVAPVVVALAALRAALRQRSTPVAHAESRPAPFGDGIPSGPRARAIVCAAAAAALFGFTVGNTMVYARSWDIVKFFGVGELFGNIVLVWLAMRMFRARGAWRAVAVSILVLSCWSGALWLVRHGPRQSWAVAPERGDGQGDAAEDFSRAYGTAIGPRERLFALDTRLTRTGFLLPGTDWQSHRDLRALLLDRAAADRFTRAKRDATATLSAASLCALGATRVALRPEDVRSLGAVAQQALRDGARFVRTPPNAEATGGFVVYQVHDDCH